MRAIECRMCHSKDLTKDIIGINKKLLGKDTSKYYCLTCLSIYLGCNQQDILDKIEEFRDEGCSYFK